MWSRTIIAGVKLHHFLVCYFLRSFAVLIAQVFLVSPFTYFFTENKDINSLLLLHMRLILSGIFGIVLGLLIASFASIRVASCFNNDLFLSSICISGIVWPLEGQPKILRMFSVISPFSNFVAATRQIAFKSGSIYNREVQISLIVISGWLALFLGLILILMKRKF